MSRTREKQLQIGFALTLALAVVLGALAYGNVQAVFRLAASARSAQILILEMSRMGAALQDAQAAERNALNTGDAASQAAYAQADLRMHAQWQTLTRLAAAEPSAQPDIARLRLSLDAATAAMGAAAAGRRPKGRDSGQGDRDSGQGDMDAAREIIAAVVTRETRLWERREQRRSALHWTILWQVKSVIGTEFILLLWAYGLARRDAESRARAFAAQASQTTQMETQHEELVAQQVELALFARDLEAANARMEAASRRFEELYQALPVPCFCHDAEGRIYEWNRAFETHYDLTPTQIFQRPVWEAISAPDAETVLRDTITRALADEPLDDWELTLPGPAGPPRHILCNTVPMRGPDGQITGGISTHLDITDRKQMEGALHKERGFLSALLDNLQEGIVACDADGALTLFNRATHEFHGLPETPLPPDRWAEHFDLYHADGTTPMTTEAVPLFRAFQGELVSDSEMVIAPRSGPARTLLANGQAILDAEGRKIGAVVAMHDITRRKSVEEALRTSEARLQTFHDITAASGASLDEQIEQLLRLGCRQFGMRTGIVAQMDAERYQVRHVVSPEETLNTDFVCDSRDTLCESMFQTAQPLAIPDIGGCDWRRHPAYALFGIEAYFGAPLRVGGEAWGTLCFTDPIPRDAFTHAETDFLRLIAQWIAGEVERRQSQQRVLDSEERFRSAIRSMQEGLVVQDADGNLLLCNEAAGRIFGVSAEDLMRRWAVRAEWRAVRHDGTSFPHAEQPPRRALETGKPQQDVTLGLQHPEGRIVWLSMNAAPLYRAGEVDAPYAAVVTFTDITERRRQESQIAAQMGQIREYNILLESQKSELEAQKTEVEQQRQTLEMQKRILERTNLSLEVANTALESLATVDGLTGLKNHRAFQGRLETEVRRAHRYGEALSLIMLDVDLFKQYNDTYGHPAGDEVLRAVGRLMEQSDRETDMAARYGGEEFVIILPNTDSAGARIVAERLRRSIAEQAWQYRPVTASLGLSTLTPAMTDRADLVAAADAALYRAKRAGRNCTVHAADHEPTTLAQS